MYNQYNLGGNSFIPRRGLNWRGFLNNTQKTLGIINQIIPIVYQVKPLVSNARTLFKIAGAVNSNDDNSQNNVNEEQVINNYSTSIEKDSNSPVFFL